MSRASGVIQNFINGVSEQPAAVRLPTQVETQINAYSTIVRGLLKRFPSHHVAKLSGFTTAGAKLHTIDRDQNERYEVSFRTDDIDVVDLAGVSKTVNFADATFTSLNAVSATGNGNSQRLYTAAGDTNVNVITTGTFVGTVYLMESTTGAFLGEETIVGAAITTATTSARTLVSGRWYMVQCAGYTSGTITAVIEWKSTNYLQGTPETDLEATSVADYTFLINKGITVLSDQYTLSSTRNPEALIHVVSSQTGMVAKYIIKIDDVVVAEYRPGDGNTNSEKQQLDTQNIAQALIDGTGTFTIAAADNGTVVKYLSAHLTGYGTEFIVTKYGNVIHIENVDGNEFTVSVESDGDVNHDRLRAHKGTVRTFTELPNFSNIGFRLKVAGSEATDFDDYYVEYIKDTDNDAGGVWREVVAPGIETNLDFNTMPHTLVREADGTFTFGRQTWDSRGAGDLETLPWPTFVGNVIQGISFFKNRLVFSTDENIVTSRAGSFFNFFKETVTTLLDDDPIDIAINHPKVSVINHLVPVGDRLIAFAGLTQFGVHGAENDGLFTPSTVTIDTLSTHRVDPDCDPARAGTSVFFAVNRDTSTGVRDMQFGDVRPGQAPPTPSVTDHCPGFLPANMTKLTAAAEANAVVGISSDQLKRLYVYKYYWSGQEKLQSSWSYYESDWDILDAEFVDDDLILVTTDGTDTYLETLPFNEDFTDSGDLYICLDHRVHTDALAAGSYASGPDETTFTLPYDASGVTCVTAATHTLGLGVNVVVNDDTAGTTVKVAGDQSAEDLYFGFTYDETVVLSELVAKKQVGGQRGSATALVAGDLTLQHLELLMGQSGYLTAEVSSSYRDTFTHVFTGAALGAADNLVGKPSLDWDKWTIPVGQPTKEIVISLKSSSYLPSALLNGEWIGQLYRRGI